MFKIIGFDADDTLWHNESIYAAVQAGYAALLAGYAAPEETARALHDTEMRNLGLYGYGIKSFTLSMLENAIRLSRGRITPAEMEAVLEMGRSMLTAPVELLDGVRQAVAVLAQSARLVIITKGDLCDQEGKVERSGLREYFEHVEIVSDKTPAAYTALLSRLGVAPQDFLMVGNSLRSDVLPVLELGGWAVYIPYHITWAHEEAALPEGAQRFYRLERIGQLPALVKAGGRLKGRGIA